MTVSGRLAKVRIRVGATVPVLKFGWEWAERQACNDATSNKIARQKNRKHNTIVMGGRLKLGSSGRTGTFSSRTYVLTTEVLNKNQVTKEIR